MDVKIPEEYLKKVVSDYKYEIQKKQGGFGLILNDMGVEVFEDTDWSNVFDEPVLQFLMDFGYGQDYDQWFLGNKGFSLDEFGNRPPELADHYTIPANIESALFDKYVGAFLNSVDEIPDPELFKNIPDSMVGKMIENNYFNSNYSPEEILKIYDITGRDEILPKEIKEVFLF